MKGRGKITLAVYEVEITKLRNEIKVAQLVENENQIDKNKLEMLLAQSGLFLTNIEALCRSFSTRNKQLFANFAFPKGILWEIEGYRTPETAYIFTVLRDLREEKTLDLQMVTLPGKLSNQLFQWLKSLSIGVDRFVQFSYSKKLLTR